MTKDYTNLIKMCTNQLIQIFGEQSKELQIFQRICADTSNPHLIRACYHRLLTQQPTQTNTHNNTSTNTQHNNK